ncbi:hypothetical protein EGI98_07275 [Stenotrophomonas maltophilia]|nr:hypothetical protein EGI98_07275 [Stenotrophomonas maltophilia]
MGNVGPPPAWEISMNERDKDQDPKQGIQESRQDRKQDDVAKQRPGQRDQQVRDRHSRSPHRKDGGEEPA